jgi:hypothetical protein
MSNTLEIDIEVTKGKIEKRVYEGVSYGDITYNSQDEPTMLIFHKVEDGERTKVYLPFYNIRGINYTPNKVKED